MTPIKISWGSAVVIAFVAFISFILYFVVQMTVNSRSNHDLVSPDYYQKELQFQEDMAAQQRAKALETPLIISANWEGIILEFPPQMSTQTPEIRGKLFLSKPDNKNLDQELSLQLQGSQMRIPASQLVEGRWNLVVDWEFQGLTYRIEQGINLNLAPL